MTKPWLKVFKDIGMIWMHDGNPKRPYAQLSSKKISDGYVNCTSLIARPSLLKNAVADLMGKYTLPPRQCMIVGQAMGSITIADHVAQYVGVEARMCWSIKTTYDVMQIDSRFALDGTIPAIIVEDVTTTGGTTLKTIRALKTLNVPLLPFILTIVNRSEATEIEGLEIRSLVKLEIATWDWGHNPYTDNGLELVSAVRPKENWKALTQEYT